MPPENQTRQSQVQKTSSGPTIGILIILVVLLLGAFYFWGERMNQNDTNPPPYIPGDVSTTTPA